jgi:hypothetical protein
MCEEAAVACFKLLYRQSPLGNVERYEMHPARDSNCKPPKYESDTSPLCHYAQYLFICLQQRKALQLREAYTV